MTLSRREFGLGAAGLAVAGGIGLGYRHIFGKWYAPTPFDDLLHQIIDREPASLLGKTAIKTMSGATADSLAVRLRQPGFALEKRARADAAAGRLTEVDGWMVPETVALYSALAAQFS